MFENREDAGRRLAELLGVYAKRNDVVVLGIPRGGVSVAFEVAMALGAPLDIFVSRKLGCPDQKELAFGAVATGGVRLLDRQVIESLGILKEEIEQITEHERAEVERRERLYRGSKPALDLAGKIAILIDDGIATGSSMLAAIAALRQLKPARIVVAVPVAPALTCHKLRSAVDEMVCLYTPEAFYAIGNFYLDFSQVSDEEVTHLLRRASTRTEHQRA
jgi:putative phosphoribosyl transferase